MLIVMIPKLVVDHLTIYNFRLMKKNAELLMTEILDF